MAQVDELLHPLRALLPYEQDSEHQINAGHAGVGVSDDQLRKSISVFDFGTVSDAEGAKLGAVYYGCQTQTDFKDFNQCLKDNTQNFSTAEKLQLQVYLGSGFSAGYDYKQLAEKDLGKRTCQQIYQNFVAGGTHGGVCREIMTCLNDTLSYVGFDQAETSSLLWNSDGKGNSPGVHLDSIFRDPKTNMYYLRNYADIYPIRANSLEEATIKASNFLGPFTSVNHIEAKRGVIIVQETDLGRWEAKNIRDEAKLPRRGAFDIQAGTQGTVVRVRKGLLGASFVQSNGSQQLDANIILTKDDTHRLGKHGQYRLQNETELGISQVSRSRGTYYQPNDRNFAESVTVTRSGFNFLTDSHAIFRPGSQANPLQLEASLKVDSLQSRGILPGGGENQTQPYIEGAIGASLLSRHTHRGTDFSISQRENVTSASQLDSGRLALNGRTQIDATHYMGKYLKLIGRYNAYGTTLHPDATGGAICVYGSSNLYFAQACHAQYMSNPSGNPYFYMEHPAQSVTAGIKKTWENRNGSKDSVEVSARHTNARTPQTLDISGVQPMPNGEAAGNSINLTLKHND